MFSPLDAWFREHLYAVVFLGALVDAVGIPFPGRIMLITLGSLSAPAWDDPTSASMVIALAVAGTVVGDHVCYLLERLGGRRLFQRYGRLVRLSKERMATADRFLPRFGGLALVLGRLAATLRIIVTPLAVARGMSYARFLAFDGTGALLWAAGAVGSWVSLMGAVGAVAGLAVARAVMSIVARRRLSRRTGVSRA